MTNSNQFPEKPDFAITISSQTQLLRMVVELTRHITVLFHFPATDSQKISLAIDEAVTNVIKHSYRNDEKKQITIEYYLSSRGIKIKLIFTGIPPRTISEEINIKKMIKNKRKGGLGVQLMKRIMDSVEYKTVNGVNCCEMIKWQKAN